MITITTHPARQARIAQDPVTALTRMTPAQFRTAMATHAGANPAQLATLTAFEHLVSGHFPTYNTHPDGSIEATYTGIPGDTITAMVRPDGTLQDQP